MLKRIVFASLLVATPAMAQQSSTAEQQINSMTTDISRYVVSLGNAILADEAQIAQLRQQLTATTTQLTVMTKERDDLRAAAKPADPPK